MAAARIRSSGFHVEQHGDGVADVDFCNAGAAALLRVPGFGYPVNIERKPDERFAHGAIDWAQPRLTAREIAMLHLMNSITDRPGWDAVLADGDAAVLLDWRDEALKLPAISPPAWEWCLEELRDKAAVFRTAAYVNVLDSASRICKSDSRISSTLLRELQTRAASLLDNCSITYGGSDRRVRILADPTLFPLVYGRTNVLSSGGEVGVEDALSTVGTGVVAPAQRLHHWGHPRFLLDRTWGRGRGGAGRGRGGGRDHSQRGPWLGTGPFRFSCRFQCLPFDVDFAGEAASATEVKIRSYINNIHPIFHKSLYRTIEKVISLSIEPWNQVLVFRQRGHLPPRILTYGILWVPPKPDDWMQELRYIERECGRESAEYLEARKGVAAYVALPNMVAQPSTSIPEDWENELGLETTVYTKYLMMRHWLQPEPGVSFTYRDWRAGRAGTALFPPRDLRPQRDRTVPLPPDGDHTFYTVSIQKTFRKQGLQVVAKVVSVELSPEDPVSRETDWHVDGMLNDHIVATSIVFYDSHNVTMASGSLSFRVEADLDSSKHIYESGKFDELASVYGVHPPDDLGRDGAGGRALQTLGTVATPDGRLLAYPNVLQHRMEPCELLDRACPGRRRFLVLHLVDPHYRVCSTRNVPPQQHGWWAAAGASKVDWASRGVSQEIADQIANLVGEWPMGFDEAQSLRDEMLEEQTRATEAVQENVERYTFTAP